MTTGIRITKRYTALFLIAQSQLIKADLNKHDQ